MSNKSFLAFIPQLVDGRFELRFGDGCAGHKVSIEFTNKVPKHNVHQG